MQLAATECPGCQKHEWAQKVIRKHHGRKVYEGLSNLMMQLKRLAQEGKWDHALEETALVMFYAFSLQSPTGEDTWSS